jgi:phage tail sheath protein FI
MAFSVSPSVIIREVDASTAVPAIATPPAAIAGVFRWGPVGEAILVSSENELVSRFGEPTNDNYETFFVAADYLSYANALYVARVDNGAVTASASDTSNANTQLHTFGGFDALYPGALGNSIDVAYVKSEDFSDVLIEVSDITASRITGNTQISQTISFNSNSTSFEVVPNDRLTVADINVGDIIRIGNDSVGYQELSLSAITESSLDSAGDPTSNTSLITSYEYAFTFASNYLLTETDLSKLSLERKWKHSGVFGKAPQTDNYHIAVVDTDGSITGETNGIIELFSDVSTTAGARLSDGTTNYYVDVIDQRSNFVQVANTAHFESKTIAYESLANGTDGTSESATGLGALAEGYDLFANSNEIDVSFVLQGKGDNAGNLANYIISNVTDSRKDAVAFISPSKEAVVDENKTNAKLTNVIAYRNALQNSSYWFMDSGYKYRYDKYNDVYRYVPLNGDMAGLASRVEPYESPAGFRKGVIKNVVKLAFNPNKAQRDQLYSAEVNPVMSQVGQGIVLFGDKTGLGLPSAFGSLNVRRLFIAVEKVIANTAESFLFELNDEFSQTQFKNIVEPFLRDIQGRRGIVDFRVISDSTVNTPAVVDQGKFRANIFIKPARSINVIELTFVATRSGIEFEEIVGSI